jgi:hypothetical protein
VPSLATRAQEMTDPQLANMPQQERPDLAHRGAVQPVQKGADHGPRPARMGTHGSWKVMKARLLPLV